MSDDAVQLAGTLPGVVAALAEMEAEAVELAKTYAWNSHRSNGDVVWSARRRDLTVRHELLLRAFQIMSVQEYELSTLIGDDPFGWEREELIAWLLERATDESTLIVCRLSSRQNERSLYDD